MSKQSGTASLVWEKQILMAGDGCILLIQTQVLCLLAFSWQEDIQLEATVSHRSTHIRKRRTKVESRKLDDVGLQAFNAFIRLRLLVENRRSNSERI